MAVAFDAVSTSETANTGTSYSFAHTVGAAGASRGLVVCVASTSQSLPSGITYAGVAMTQVGASQEPSTGKRISIWSLVQPGTGINNVVISFPSAVAAAVTAISFTGVDQAIPVDSYSSATGISTTPSIPVAADADEMVVDALCFNPAASATVGADQTQRSNMTSNGFAGGATSTEPGQASVTMSWTLSTSQEWVLAACVVRAAVAPAKGTIARVLIPMSHRRGKWKKGQTHGFIAVSGWQRGPSYDNPVPPASEFFCACYMG